MYDAHVFAEQFTVYNYDRRGRGDSGNTLPYAYEREIEDIEVMIDAAGGTAYLYGHSSGAILALEAAMKLGDKVSKLVLYDASYSNNEVDQKEFNELGQGVKKLLDTGNHSEAISLFLEGIGIPIEMILFMQQSPQWETIVALAPTLAYDISLASDLPPLESARQLRVPTLIIVGEKSPASLHNVAIQLSQAISHAQFSQLAGQNHMADPTVLLPLLTDFLTQNEIGDK